MPTTAVSIDRRTFDAFHAGEESALERLFRARYEAFLAGAASELNDPGRGARAVEHATLAAWQARQEIATPDALESFLERAIQDAVAHEKARVASVHRFESFEKVHVGNHRAAPARTVDEAWTRIFAALHPQLPPPQSRQDAKHLAAQHMAQIGRRKSPIPAILGVLALALVAWGVFVWYPQQHGDGLMLRAFASPNARKVATEDGQRGSLNLADATSVQLGSHSELTVPPAFNTQLRAVHLDGTASFAVAPNGVMPFVVRAGDVTITAMGTAFDISAFTEDHQVTVRVREGTVKVKAPKETRAVAAGEAVEIGSSGAMSTPSAATLDDAFSWLNGRFVVTGRTLRETIPLLRRWYALNFKGDEGALLDRRVSFTAGIDSARTALVALQQSASVTVAYEGTRIVLRDAPQPPAKTP
jgi:ferric-dicitrate binding protein FerR (iron transport regulator)